MLGQDQVAPGRNLPSPSRHRADTAACHYRAVERVIGAMREHLEQGLSLGDMADIAIMSRFHFNRTFRQLTGIPPCRFLGAVRLEAAKRLLLTTEMRVTDICFEVGYNSLGTFIRRFTDLVGLSPRRFRALAQAAPNGAVERPEGRRTAYRRRSVASVVGQVTAPSVLPGPVFVGLFSTPLPQGPPVACAIMSSSGTYRIAEPPTGRFFLFALCVSASKDPSDNYIHQSALRGGGQAILVTESAIHGSTEVTLHPCSPLDPPILIALPSLLGVGTRNDGRTSRP